MVSKIKRIVRFTKNVGENNMNFIKYNIVNIILTSIWIIAGVCVLLSESVSKIAYATLLIVFIVTSISNMIFKYYAIKKDGE